MKKKEEGRRIARRERKVKMEEEQISEKRDEEVEDDEEEEEKRNVNVREKKRKRKRDEDGEGVEQLFKVVHVVDAIGESHVRCESRHGSEISMRRGQ